MEDKQESFIIATNITESLLHTGSILNAWGYISEQNNPKFLPHLSSDEQ